MARASARCHNRGQLKRQLGGRSAADDFLSAADLYSKLGDAHREQISRHLSRR
ncbi:hypothetical protein [Gloeobacter violaceus]|nr:hypothetical protein [Gloeobacter violaceus]